MGGEQRSAQPAIFRAIMLDPMVIGVLAVTLLRSSCGSGFEGWKLYGSFAEGFLCG